MAIEQRRHTRFSLEIPGVIIFRYGDRQESMLQQISIGGCFTGWEENIFPGDEFRLEIGLPNGNKLPLACKAVYRFENTGVGVKFTDISEFEQELVALIITEKLKSEGLPMHIDPFTQPSTSTSTPSTLRSGDERRSREDLLESVMSGDKGD